MGEKPQLINRMTRRVSNSGITEAELTAIAGSGITQAAIEAVVDSSVVTADLAALVSSSITSGEFFPKVVKATVTIADEGNEEVQSLALPTNAVVLDVFLNVTTASATDTMDVGTDGDGSNDPDGWLDGVSIGTTGLVRGSLANGASTYGALLKEDVTGSTQYAKNIDVTSGGESLSVTASAGSNTAVIDVYIVYIEIV